jgi:membrane fusion protein (multidrug efflux system)
MSAPKVRRGLTIDPTADADNSARLNIVILDEDKALLVAEPVDARITREIPLDEPALLPPPAEEIANNNLRSRWQKLSRLRKTAVMSIVGVVAALAAGFVYHYVTVGRFMVTTDDAYVRAYNTTLAAKVSGYIAKVHVEENTHVRAGDLIASLDDGDYRLAATAARDKMVTQEATVDRVGRQVIAQQANVSQARAQLASTQAAARRATQELERQRTLTEGGSASRQALETVQMNYDQALASVQNAGAAVEAAQANVDVLKAQQEEAARTLKELRTMQARAERDLSFTEIRSPIDGFVSNRALHQGDFVNVGQRVASIVPLDEVYVIANFKETQLARLIPGQPVNIKIDALPDRKLIGTVASVSPASGAVFALLPPDNATGNFTKIVQRLPVRIRIPTDVAAERLLRPGMSVVVSVDTRTQAEARAGLPASAGAAELPKK